MQLIFIWSILINETNLVELNVEMFYSEFWNI